jgi:outer membrane protein TolC
MTRLLSVLTALLLLSACATNAPRHSPASVAPPVWNPESASPDIPATSREEAATGADLVPAPESTVPLRLEEAIIAAFERNLSIEVSELDPEIAETFIDEARADFDPAVAASIRTGRNTRRIETDNRTTGIGTVISNGARPGADDSPLDLIFDGIETVVGSLQPSTTTSRVRDVTGGAALSQRLPTGTAITATADYTEVDSNVARDSFEGGWNLEVSQALLRGAGLNVNLATLRRARNNAAISFHAFRRQVLNVVRDVELRYWDLVRAREVLAISEFAVQLAAEQERLTQDLLAAGRGVEADVLSAQAERATRQADVTDALAQIKATNIALVRLMNPQQENPFAIAYQPETPPDTPAVAVEEAQSTQLAMQYRPELAQVRLDLANADIDVLAARNGLLPRLDLVGSYGRANGGRARRSPRCLQRLRRRRGRRGICRRPGVRHAGAAPRREGALSPQQTEPDAERAHHRGQRAGGGSGDAAGRGGSAAAMGAHRAHAGGSAGAAARAGNRPGPLHLRPLHRAGCADCAAQLHPGAA